MVAVVEVTAAEAMVEAASTAAAGMVASAAATVDTVLAALGWALA
jgi:hypothetical protein